MDKQIYEPEGIYLGQLTEPIGPLVQQWGEQSHYFNQYKYNGTPLLGYFGLGFQVEQKADILAADTGKVMEISIDEGGLDKYIKIEHWWGESIYALLGKIHVVSGQTIERGKKIATIGKMLANQLNANKTSRFHFGIRVYPHDRFDGWGGFSDPLPYIDPLSILYASDVIPEANSLYKPLALLDELPFMRRP